MDKKVLGLHHITAIAANANKNHRFYTGVLGLRLVKKTVNFDAPDTYHFYYGNENGTPGTLLTFFPWENSGQGRNGTGITSEIGYSVPEGSLDFWKNRLSEHGVKTGAPVERFGEVYLPFEDPDGLHLSLVVSKNKDERVGWATKEVSQNEAFKGFHNITLTLREAEPTVKVLEDILGYNVVKQDGNNFRLHNATDVPAGVIDLKIDEKGRRAYNASGTVHHVAFRVANEDDQMAIREKVLSMGLRTTPKIDRNYFFSIYFREPGGVLFEVATDNPGFLTDETLAELGTHLMLPPQYEGHRKQIEKVLPVLS